MNGLKVGAVIGQELQSHSLISESANILIRNAAAHYDYEIHEQGIEFRDKAVRMGAYA